MKRIVKGLIAAASVPRRGDASGIEPPRGAGGPQRAVRRQHRHLRLGVGRRARQALPDHELQPAPRAGSGQPGLARLQRLPLRVPHRQGHEPQGRGRSTASSSRTRSRPKRRPSADGSAGRRQRAALAAHRRHRDHDGHARRRRRATPTPVGPRREPAGPARTTTARRPIGSSTASAPSRATTPAIPTSREVGSLRSGVRRHASSTRSPTAGGSSPASSTIPISSTRRASSTSST